MAMKQGTEYYTKWTHMENSSPMTRRIHRIEIQARNGELYVIKGEDLPECITTACGVGLKGKHLAQILIRPKSVAKTSPYPAPKANAWPSWRDIVSLGIGFFGFVIFRFVVSLFEACL
jgi:hypothetical protein